MYKSLNFEREANFSKDFKEVSLIEYEEIDFHKIFGDKH